MFLLLFAPFRAVSQVQDEVARLGQLYESLQFEAVIQTGRQLLKHPEQFSTDQLATIHEFMGLAHFSLGNLDSARSHFVSELELDPTRQLDPVRVSPKIIEFFEQLRQELHQSSAQTTFVPYTRYVFIKDRRPGAAWRSAVLPGWGQWYKHQKGRAKIIGGVFLGSTVFTGVAFYLERRSRRDYLRSKLPDEIRKNYDRYNFWYRTRQIGVHLMVAVWAIAVGDALWTPAPPLKIEPTVSGPQAPGVQLRFQW
ncbi:MAG: hypothetical protein GXO78_12835 [Calditrichaeota bacterium]|nr:hypothetical protein [Calditrichota bacterium]